MSNDNYEQALRRRIDDAEGFKEKAAEIGRAAAGKFNLQEEIDHVRKLPIGQRKAYLKAKEPFYRQAVAAIIDGGMNSMRTEIEESVIKQYKKILGI